MSEPAVSAPFLKDYRLIESRETEEGVLSLWHSPGNMDAAWDEFLMATPMGQFQQSSMWARVKEAEGWESLRVLATIEDRIAGGFQILWRKTRLGRIGYVSKGPVAVPETEGLAELIAAQMREHATHTNIIGLIVQPPDESRITSDILGRSHFTEGNPMEVIETTLLVDVSKGPEALDKGMSRKDSLRKVRVAKQHGVTVREGTEEDIELFFDLMRATCARQGVTPNPPTVEALRQLWLTFSRRGCLRVTFAECNHAAPAGFLNILFGKKVTLWKKGWNFAYPDRYPNDVLYYETLHWACSHHYNHCDVVSFDRGIADALRNGKPLSNVQKKSRNIFHLRFGGVPKILPPARLWIANPLLRFGYENVLARVTRFRHLSTAGL